MSFNSHLLTNLYYTYVTYIFIKLCARPYTDTAIIIFVYQTYHNDISSVRSISNVITIILLTIVIDFLPHHFLSDAQHSKHFNLIQRAHQSLNVYRIQHSVTADNSERSLIDFYHLTFVHITSSLTHKLPVTLTPRT